MGRFLVAALLVGVGVILFRAASNDWLKNWSAAWGLVKAKP